MNDAQLLFDFNSAYVPETPQNLEESDSCESSGPVDKPSSSEGMPIRDIRRAAIAWLVGQGAKGIGVNVATRVKRFKADVVGFWNEHTRNRSSNRPVEIMSPTRTMVIICGENRYDCWPDYTRSSKLLPRLRELNQDRLNLEASIRTSEPHLRESTALFDEFSEWNYDKTFNPEYHEIRLQIKSTESAIYKGSRFEQMQTAKVADQLVLAVPENTLDPQELAEGWGLLSIKPNFEASLILEPENQSCSMENQFHLIQNAASATTEHLLFSHGIRERNENLHFLRLPRRRNITATTPKISY